VLDGTDAVMLSAETAVGKHPIETVICMAAICVEAEKSEVVHLDTDFLDQKFERIDQSIAYGALFTAHHLGAKAIVALTDSGSTALWMSRYPIHVPIYALTENICAHRAMCLFRNVVPMHITTNHDRDIALHEAETLLRGCGLVQDSDTIVLTVGEPMGKAGGTNTLKIVHVGHTTPGSSS
jgi:pyruvate kinase